MKPSSKKWISFSTKTTEFNFHSVIDSVVENQKQLFESVR